MVHDKLILPQRVNQPNHMLPSVLWKVGFLVFPMMPYGQNSSIMLNVLYIFEDVFLFPVWSLGKSSCLLGGVFTVCKFLLSFLFCGHEA
jgi:hypothetical protein